MLIRRDELMGRVSAVTCRPPSFAGARWIFGCLSFSLSEDTPNCYYPMLFIHCSCVQNL